MNTSRITFLKGEMMILKIREKDVLMLLLLFCYCIYLRGVRYAAP
jgi:hypothetical protein